MQIESYSHVKKQLYWGFGLIVFLFMFVGVTSLVEITALGDLTTKIYQHPLKVSSAALRARNGIVRMHRDMKDVVLSDDKNSLLSAVTHVAEDEKKVLAHLDIIQERILGEEGQSLAQKTREIFIEWRPIRHEVISLVKKGEVKKAAQITQEKGAEHEFLLEQQMFELTIYAQNKADGFIDKAMEVKKRFLIFSGITVAAGVFCSALIAFFTAKQILAAYKLRKQAEGELKKSERKFRNLLESTSTIPWELDLKNNRFTYMGKQIEQALGYSVESWKDLSSWAARIHHEDRERAVQFCEIETQKGNDHDFIYRATHQDGSIRWIRDVVSVVISEDGDKSLVGFMHDITKQKKLSLEKERLETRLQHSQRIEAIGTLAGGIAHDFNNLLGVIIGYSGLAKEDAAADTKYSKDLDNVLIAAHKAKELVKQILAFSRQSEVKYLPINIQPLIKEGLKLLRSSIPSTISIVEVIEQRISIVLADPTQIHQILTNLCTNAYHAMGDCGGVLSVTLKDTVFYSGEKNTPVELNPGKYVELIVADTGSGIRSDIIGKIFEPYFTTKKVGQGTGMGLSIIHGIVAEYGGKITVDSELGQGTAFHVYLPAVVSEEAQSTKQFESMVGGKERILFIDDEELLAEMGKDMLERMGYQVTVCRSSLKALATFQKFPNEFDLVITDQTMPDLTGADLSRRMLQIRPDIPIILCTGYSNLIDEDSAKTIGIREFALKPLEKSVIGELIRKVLCGEEPVNNSV